MVSATGPLEESQLVCTSGSYCLRGSLSRNVVWCSVSSLSGSRMATLEPLVPLHGQGNSQLKRESYVPVLPGAELCRTLEEADTSILGEVQVEVEKSA